MATSTDPDAWLRGQLLIATPAIGDDRFDRSVIFVCTHSEDAAMGLIINKPYGELRMGQLFDQLDVDHVETEDADAPVLFGGPIDNDRGFVLHSGDYKAGQGTITVTDGIRLTATRDALEAIAGPDGPERALLALGYAGWGPGQLEEELQGNAWLTCAATDDLVFGDNLADKWTLALQSIGVEPAKLSSLTGHA